jgi:KRAB domain-containing zinc finger protein
LTIYFWRHSKLSEATKLSGKAYQKIRQYKCLKCKKAFKKEAYLKQHQMVHSNVRNYVCDICGHSSKTKQNLEVHMRTHSDLRIFECRHQLNHRNERKFQCLICKKGLKQNGWWFKQKDGLRCHKVVHTDVKKFKCNICKKAFKTKSNLIRHQKQHAEFFYVEIMWKNLENINITLEMFVLKPELRNCNSNLWYRFL